MNEIVAKTRDILNSGGVILYPTDTVWGIGCDATNQEAVRKVYSIKEREDSKAMLILVNSETMLQQYVPEIPDAAWDILDSAVDPVTIIYPNVRNLAPNIPADDGSVGIRMVRDGFVFNLLSSFRRPIVSTSANIAGMNTPIDRKSIDDLVVERVDYAVPDTFGRNSTGKPSSIIKFFPDNTFRIVRM